MYNALKGEIYKISKGKLWYVLILTMILIPVLSHLTIYHLQDSNSLAEDMLSKFSNINVWSFLAMSVKELITGGFALIIVTLVGVNLLSEENSTGMLKIRVMSSTRQNIFLSKFITICIYIGSLILVHFISSFVIGVVFYGWSTNFETLFSAVLSYVLAWHTLLVYGLLMMSFGFLFKKPTAALISGLGIYILISICVQLLPNTLLWFVPIGYSLLTIGNFAVEFGVQTILSTGIYLFVGMIWLYLSIKHKELA